MFICNFKVNGAKCKKIAIIIGIFLVFMLIAFIFYKSINNIFVFRVNDEVSAEDVNVIDSQNYTNILQSVHENVDLYVGQKIKFSGYVYRVYDFNSNQFVLARDMIISSDFQTVVVGFMCESNETCNFKDNCWVEVEGEITKGSYHGELPIIRVTKINEITKPSDEYVYPPSDNYIPTSAVY